MSKKLFNYNIAAPILDALSTGMQELVLVAGASNFQTGRTKEGVTVSFNIVTEYMANGANKVTITQHKDDTYSISFERYSRGEVDRISHCEKDKLEPTWWEHTGCAVKIPIIAHPQIFDPGPVAASLGAQSEFFASEIRVALNRHLAGDWGDICEDDKQANNADLVHGGHLVSAYMYGGRKLRVVTEGVDDKGNRAGTLAMLPSEY